MLNWFRRLFRAAPVADKITLAQKHKAPDFGVLAPVLADLCNYWDVRIETSDIHRPGLMFFRFESRFSYGPPAAHVLIDALYNASRAEDYLVYKQDLERALWDSCGWGKPLLRFGTSERGWLEVRHTGMNMGIRSMPSVLMLLYCAPDQLAWWRDTLCPDLTPTAQSLETQPCLA